MARRQLREKLEQAVTEADLYKKKYLFLREELERTQSGRSPIERGRVLVSKKYGGSSQSPQSVLHGNGKTLYLPAAQQHPPLQHSKPYKFVMPPVQIMRSSSTGLDGDELKHIKKQNRQDLLHASLGLEKQQPRVDASVHLPSSPIPKGGGHELKRERHRRLGSLPKEVYSTTAADVTQFIHIH